MERSASTLVLVAHPGDETLAFSTVCAGADVVSVTDGSGPGFAEEFRGACDRLGAKRSALARPCQTLTHGGYPKRC